MSGMDSRNASLSRSHIGVGLAHFSLRGQNTQISPTPRLIERRLFK